MARSVVEAFVWSASRADQRSTAKGENLDPPRVRTFPLSQTCVFDMNMFAGLVDTFRSTRLSRGPLRDSHTLRDRLLYWPPAARHFQCVLIP